MNVLPSSNQRGRATSHLLTADGVSLTVDPHKPIYRFHTAITSRSAVIKDAAGKETFAVCSEMSVVPRPGLENHIFKDWRQYESAVTVERRSCTSLLNQTFNILPKKFILSPELLNDTPLCGKYISMPKHTVRALIGWELQARRLETIPTPLGNLNQ